MSREIKFRAWHTQLGVMFFVGDDFGTVHPLDCCNYLRQGQPVTLMQWTGLHDKNGKEIYEGDIVHFLQPYDADDRLLYGVDMDEAFSAVEWGGHTFTFYGCCGRENRKYVEVVGHIHKHAHLLEAK